MSIYNSLLWCPSLATNDKRVSCVCMSLFACTRANQCVDAYAHGRSCFYPSHLSTGINMKPQYIQKMYAVYTCALSILLPTPPCHACLPGTSATKCVYTCTMWPHLHFNIESAHKCVYTSIHPSVSLTRIVPPQFCRRNVFNHTHTATKNQ